MPKLKDQLRKTYGRLYVFARADNAKNGNSRWHCVCACSDEIIVQGIDLGKNTNSCGCLRKEVSAARLYKDGRTKHPLYKTWIDMINRCHNPKATQFNDYGGRCIFVHTEWLNSFWQFISDMGPKPSEAHTLDRINNELGYFKLNCRWSTWHEQNSNKRVA